MSAGLVRGASKGAGLGNQFLGNIRQVSVILHLLRCFDDEENNIVTHVDGSVDPLRDLDTIETEVLCIGIKYAQIGFTEKMHNFEIAEKHS